MTFQVQQAVEKNKWAFNALSSKNHKTKGKALRKQIDSWNKRCPKWKILLTTRNEIFVTTFWKKNCDLDRMSHKKHRISDLMTHQTVVWRTGKWPNLLVINKAQNLIKVEIIKLATCRWLVWWINWKTHQTQYFLKPYQTWVSPELYFSLALGYLMAISPRTLRCSKP